MTCKCHPDSPFHWAHNPRPSVFAQDVTFRAKGPSEKSIGQVVTDNLDSRRAKGEMVGYLHGIGEQTLKKEIHLLAYKQFGVYSRAGAPAKRPNKHESK